MLTRSLCLLLAIAPALSAMNVPVLAASMNLQQPAPDQGAMEKVRSQIYKAGEGPDARIEITLRNNTRVKGYIRESGREFCIVRNAREAQDVRVEYSEVARVKVPRQFRVSPFAVKMGLVAAGVLIPIAIVASQSSRTRTVQVSSIPVR
jgi:hypothetical protein